MKLDEQVRDKGVPSSYHHGKAVSSLVDDCQTMHPPPAGNDSELLFERQVKNQKVTGVNDEKRSLQTQQVS